MDAFMVALNSVWTDSGFLAFTWGNAVMIAVGCVLLYLAFAKGFEPLLLSPIAFGCILDREFDESDDCAEGGASALDEELYGLLKGLRKDVARKHNLPPYVIFQEISMTQMATNYPRHSRRTAADTGCGTG